MIFLNMSQYRPLFVYIRPFHITIQLQIEKSLEVVHGIQTEGHRMVSADRSTELGLILDVIYPCRWNYKMCRLSFRSPPFKKLNSAIGHICRIELVHKKKEASQTLQMTHRKDMFVSSRLYLSIGHRSWKYSGWLRYGCIIKVDITK